jgi:hypothetical protein
MLVQKIDDDDKDLNNSIVIEKQEIKQTYEIDEDKEFEIDEDKEFEIDEDKEFEIKSSIES